MAEEEAIKVMEENITKQIETLGKVINERIEKLKKAMIDYLNLGGEFARASMVTTLKNI